MGQCYAVSLGVCILRRHSILTDHRRFPCSRYVHFHRVMVTRVPSPGRDSISKSFTNRFAPLNPNPNPLPEVNPSFNARSMSAMPAPLSSKVKRKPFLALLLSWSRWTWPSPPPCSRMLRANSLAAVTIFVCSTRLKPISTARVRTHCRIRTTSSEERIGTDSVTDDGTVRFLSFDRTAKQLHAFVHVQCGPHACERQAQFDERNRDGG